jgi:hypothetical protein
MTSKGHWKFLSSALITIFIAFEIAPECVQLSLSEKNAIAALHKAGLKGPPIAQETRHPLPTIYGVLKCFKQRGTVENKERSGRPFLLTPRDTRKLYDMLLIFSMSIGLDLYLIGLVKENYTAGMG